MAWQVDDQKRRAWEKRLERFHSSGLTVAKFCENEAVAVHAFYYWAKRVRVAEIKGSVAAHHSSASRRRITREKLARPAVSARSCAEVQGSTIQIRVGAAELSIPAHCLEALRCVVQCAKCTGTGSGSDDAFRQVVVSTR